MAELVVLFAGIIFESGELIVLVDSVFDGTEGAAGIDMRNLETG